MKTDKQRDTLLGADRATLGEARRDFTDAPDLTAWLATPGGRGTTRYPGPRLSVTPDP